MRSEQFQPRYTTVFFVWSNTCMIKYSMDNQILTYNSGTIKRSHIFCIFIKTSDIWLPRDLGKSLSQKTFKSIGLLVRTMALTIGYIYGSVWLWWNATSFYSWTYFVLFHLYIHKFEAAFIGRCCILNPPFIDGINERRFLVFIPFIRGE